MSSADTPQPSDLHRVDGRLHLVHHICDDQGNIKSK